ncbi:MAG TPA: hypothetical protein VFE58_13400 [Tepidisphaeraceae bacterium]|jgi:hypothetical protein|nr:hypothetical protein [Tepidisphaeraceae bacterium]
MKIAHTRAKRGFVLAVFVTTPLFITAAARASYYVSDSGSSTAAAGSTYPNDPGNSAGRDGVAGSDSHSFFSGSVAQPIVTGTISSSTDGTAYQPIHQTYLAQDAGGNLEDTATVGALHSTISAYSNTGLPMENVNNGNASAHTSDYLTWGDTVHFVSANPAGSYYTVALGLDAAIDATGTFSPYETGSFVGKAQATVTISGNLDFSQYYQPIFNIQALQGIQSDGTIVNTSYISPQTSLTFFVPYQEFINLTFAATLQTDAYATLGDGQALVNAGNTALFAISSPDPLASYTSDSGTVYATSLPEPAALGLLAAPALALAHRRNRK